MHKPVSQTTVTRTRTQKSTRPRPKTIHVDDGSVDISEASSISSRGKKGSSSNITGKFRLQKIFVDIVTNFFGLLRLKSPFNLVLEVRILLPYVMPAYSILENYAIWKVISIVNLV